MFKWWTTKCSSGQQNKNKNLNLITNDYQNMILEFCKEPKTAVEIKKYLKIKSRQYVSSKIIKPLINAGSLEYTNKLNINARNQKYLSISNCPFNNNKIL